LKWINDFQKIATSTIRVWVKDGALKSEKRMGPRGHQRLFVDEERVHELAAMDKTTRRKLLLTLCPRRKKRSTRFSEKERYTIFLQWRDEYVTQKLLAKQYATTPYIIGKIIGEQKWKQSAEQ